MKLLILFAVGVHFFALPAGAQSIVPGIYDVDGIENDGKSQYQDVVKISVSPDGECEFDLGTAPDVIPGLCLIDGDVLSASSVVGGHWFGLYRTTAEGVLQGTWRIEGEAGTGSETLKLRK